jgi:hypothetical protein
VSRWLALSLLLVTSAAHADGTRVDVNVGQSVEVLVGYARGLICDDLSIIDADLHAKTDDNNALTVTGKAVGTTMCRVGTDALRVRYLFEIHVNPAPPPPPPPAPPVTKKPPPSDDDSGSGSAAAKKKPAKPS